MVLTLLLAYFYCAYKYVNGQFQEKNINLLYIILLDTGISKSCTSDMDVEKDKLFRKLLSFLNDQVTEMDHITVTAKTYLNPKDYCSKDFLEICETLERQGDLKFDKLGILNDFFPEDKYNKACSEILKTQKEIRGK